MPYKIILPSNPHTIILTPLRKTADRYLSLNPSGTSIFISITSSEWRALLQCQARVARTKRYQDVDSDVRDKLPWAPADWKKQSIRVKLGCWLNENGDARTLRKIEDENEHESSSRGNIQAVQLVEGGRVERLKSRLRSLSGAGRSTSRPEVVGLVYSERGPRNKNIITECSCNDQIITAWYVDVGPPKFSNSECQVPTPRGEAKHDDNKAPRRDIEMYRYVYAIIY